MPTHTIHSIKEAFYFVTFTCYKWLPLIEQTRLYDYLVGWSYQLANRGVLNCGYVIMPNHIHILVYVEDKCHDFNTIIGNSKRFMAYEIVQRLMRSDQTKIIRLLKEGVQPCEREKGKKHQVFRLSFDAKLVSGNKEINRVLDYIHHNPVSGKWNLIDDFARYEHSSACYYELGLTSGLRIYDYRCVNSE